jgi:hypothetical protein
VVFRGLIRTLVEIEIVNTLAKVRPYLHSPLNANEHGVVAETLATHNLGPLPKSANALKISNAISLVRLF